MTIATESMRITWPSITNRSNITVLRNKIPTKGVNSPKPTREKRRMRNNMAILPMKIGGAYTIARSCCGPNKSPVRNPENIQGSSLTKNKRGFVDIRKKGESEIMIKGVNISISGSPVTPKSIRLSI